MPILANIYYAQFKGSSLYRPPLILIHGAGSHHLVWPAEIRRLRATTVFAIDLPGHGKSSGCAYHHVRQYQSSLINLIAALGVNRAVLVGHSLGAAIALQFAHDHPQHVDGLVCLSAAASFQLDPTFVEQFRLPQARKATLELLKAYFEPKHGNRTWYPRFVKSLAEIRNSLWYADLRATATFDLHNNLPHIKTPTLILAGTADPLVSYSSASSLAQQLPNATLNRYNHHGHLLMLEDPKRLAHDIHTFYNSLLTE